MNTFGHFFRVTTFGESHGPGLGVVMDGLPAGLPLNLQELQKDLDRRRPGQSAFTTSRQEPDRCEHLAGLSSEGLTNGAPLTFIIRNLDQRGGDYQREAFRPGHADWPYFKKYGLPPQPGGGRSSGRETVARVAAGAVARQLLKPLGVAVRSFTVAIGELRAFKIDPDFAETDPLRFADPELAPEAQKLVLAAKEQGDSLGGAVEVQALNVPPGLGEPVFGKLEALLGAAYFSIGAVRGVEFGAAALAAVGRGSEMNDPLGPDGPLSNRHGGVLGGISTGQPIIARLLVKPTPSVSRPQRTVDLSGRALKLNTAGRHDPCLTARLGPVAEAMTLITLLDAYLAHRARFNWNASLKTAFSW